MLLSFPPKTVYGRQRVKMFLPLNPARLASPVQKD
jgi:hypothetical protein